MNVKHFLLFILICTFIIPGNDANAHQNFHFSPRISNLQVRDICQDSLGYLWIATARGVNRYNGYEYAQLLRNESYPNESIQSNRINKLHLDPFNNLWIGSSRGLSRYDMEHGNTTPYKINNQQEEYYVTDLAEDASGDLWVTTYSDGLLKFDRETEKLTKITPTYKLPAPQQAQTLYIDDQQNLWIGYSNGSALGRYNIKDHSAKLYPLPDYMEINCVIKFEQSQIWVGTDQGILAYDLHAEKRTPLPENLRTQNALSNAKINSIELMDSSNYIITSTHYAYKYCLKTGAITTLSLKKGKNNRNSDITCALKDRQGNVWFGTFEQGIAMINTTESMFNHPNSSIPLLNGKSTTVSCEDKKFGRFWFGSKYDGLYLRTRNGTVVNFTKENHPALASVGNSTIRALFCDAQGRIWIGVGRNLVIGQLHESGFSEIALLKNFGPVTTMNEDQTGGIWVGTFSGLYYFGQEATGRPIQVVDKESITAILPYKNNRMIYAAYGKNLLVIDNKDFQSKPLIAEKLLPDPFTLNACTDICWSADGTLWIGNYTKGLIRYIPDKKHIETYTQQQGLPSNDILALSEDKNGQIWLATSNGLSQFDPKTNQFRNFNEADGLLNTQFFEQAMLNGSDGLIYIGGNAGVDCFNPDAIKPNHYHPVGILEDIKIQNKSVVAQRENAPISKTISYEQGITLSHRQNSFSIDYTGIDYNSTDKLRYSYQLEGFDREWVEAENNKKASYANLPAGKYRFKLKVKSADGVWSPETSIDITVKTSPWLTGWAYALYILIILTGIILAVKLYFRTEYNKKALALSEKQRLHEQEINQQKIDFYGNISHELRTPLTLINGNIELLAQHTDTDNHDNRLISMLAYNSNRLLRLVNQLLDFSRIGHDHIPLCVVETDIVPIVRNVTDAFGFNIQTREIDYALHLEQESIKIYTDEDVLEKIMTNLISNAVKYTPQKGKITIDVKRLTGSVAARRYHHPQMFGMEYLEFNISNTCSVIGQAQLDQMFERFTRLENTLAEGQTSGNGIGLHYTKMLVLRQKGVIQATSTETEGMTLSFVIPTEKRAFLPEEIGEREDMQEKPEYPAGSSALLEMDSPVIQEPTPKESTILIVEDDPQIHSLLHEILRHEYNLLHAYNGTEGYEMLRERMPEMVISDIRMPEMDGMALCKKIKNDPQLSHILVILLTAKTRIEERIEGYRYGADAYINKPFRVDHLISVIHNQMDNRNRLKTYFIDQSLYTNNRTEDDHDPISDSLSDIDQRFMEKLHSFIEKSIENPDININVIAVELGFSRTSFYRKMKSLTGLAPNDYVRNFKMKKAAKLILEGNLSIAEISDQTGFGTQSHFSTAFKKYFGVSPKDYKEKWNEERKEARMKQKTTRKSAI